MTTQERAAAIAAERERMQAEGQQRTTQALTVERAVLALREVIRERREAQAGCVLAAESEPFSNLAARQMRRAGRLDEDIATLLDAIRVLQHPNRTWPLDEDE